MIDALRLMIARSPQASGQAIDCIKAIKAKSPVLQHRYNRAAEAAFADPNAEFAPDERELIASYIDDEGGDGPKLLDVRIRVDQAEKAAIQQMATDAGMTVTEFIRSKIF